MAAINVLKSSHTSLSTTTVDTVQLLQPWDGIEISNRDNTQPLYVTFNGTTPAAAADNTEIVEAGVTKLFPGLSTGNGVPGSTSLPCHQVKVIGSGNAYSVTGVAGK